MLKILYARFLGLSSVILAQFTFKCVSQPEVAEQK